MLPPITKNLRSFQFGPQPFQVNDVAHCENAIIYDKSGYKWIDFSVGGLGYNHPSIIEAARYQASHLPLSSRVFFSKPLAAFSKKLASLLPSGLSVSYPCNSPAEAVEGAIKLAMGYHPNRRRVISFAGQYHGNTWGAMAVCGIEAARNRLRHFPFQASFLDFGNLDELSTTNFRQSSCVLLEPIGALGASGSGDLERYLILLQKKCAESKALLVVNESNIGIGNSGDWTWCQQVGLIPDIIVLGNSLGAGLMPTGAYVARVEINDAVYRRAHPALHGGTTAGNPLMCAIGKKVLEVVEQENLIAKVATFMPFFKEFEGNLSIQGIESARSGLILVIKLPSVEHARNVVKSCRDEMLLLKTLPGNERFLLVNPPLLVSKEDMTLGLAVLSANIQLALKS